MDFVDNVDKIFRVQEKLRSHREDFRKREEWNYAPFAIKYPQAETEDTGFLPVDNVEKLQAEETFTDFQHIPCPHSYQQITIYAIF